MCFFCHPYEIPAEIFSRQQKKIVGDKRNTVPRMQGICKDMIEVNQYNASKPNTLYD
jgi:hypothetical protein